MVEARMSVGLRHWIDPAKKAPAELHLFENTYYAERITWCSRSAPEPLPSWPGGWDDCVADPARASGWAAAAVNQDFYARRSVALTPRIYREILPLWPVLDSSEVPTWINGSTTNLPLSIWRGAARRVERYTPKTARRICAAISVYAKP